MRIALISFEFPPSVAIGGIGAYASEAAKMLVLAGHDVEVFAAGISSALAQCPEGALVHRVIAQDRTAFRNNILPAFAESHMRLPFDVIEAPEVGAEAYCIAQRYPEVPLVIKLHTPSYIIGKLSYEHPGRMERLRFTLGAVRRGRWSTLTAPTYDADQDLEAITARRASWIAAPSTSIAERLVQDWNLLPERLTTFPLPYCPDQALLGLPLPSHVKTIGFLGRLEPRKGMIELARAIPMVLQKAPHLRFRMLGPSWPYKRGQMQDWMRNELGRFANSVDFVGPIQRDSLTAELQKCDAIVLPSRWENFPFACWESMAAARLVVGSRAGGMADIIRDGVDGRLTEPGDPSALAKILLEVSSLNGQQLSSMCSSGRSRILEKLCPDSILPQQMECYRNAIFSTFRTTVVDPQM